MNTANRITISRLLLIPVFIAAFEIHCATGDTRFRWTAFGLFSLASVLDGVDGWIARKFHQQTALGAFLDPLADKLLLVSAMGLLTWQRCALSPLPAFLFEFTLVRDVLLTCGFVFLRCRLGGLDIRPHWLGKWATVGQMAAILWTLGGFSDTGLLVVSTSATVLTVASGLQYLRQALRKSL